jgi:hypothetical protein
MKAPNTTNTNSAMTTRFQRLKLFSIPGFAGRKCHKIGSSLLVRITSSCSNSVVAHQRVELEVSHLPGVPEGVPSLRNPALRSLKRRLRQPRNELLHFRAYLLDVSLCDAVSSDKKITNAGRESPVETRS